MAQQLTQKAVEKAIASGEVVEKRDTRAKGLTLRVSAPGRYEWSIRRMKSGKSKRFSLGTDLSLDEARGIVAMFDLAAAGAYSESPWVTDSNWERRLLAHKAKLRGFDITPRAPVAQAPEPKAPPSIPWHEAEREFVAEIYRTRREKTAQNYCADLNAGELRKYRDVLVKDVTIEQMAEALKAISARGKERYAETVAVAVRRLFAWCGADSQRARTSVPKDTMKDLRAPERTLDEEANEDDDNSGAVPIADDIARIMHALDREDLAPLRDRLAAKLVVYTAQRRRSVARARKSDFVSDLEGLGGYWLIPAMHSKTAAKRARRGLAVADHVIPLPPRAWAIVVAAKKVAGDSEYLFPATRDRRSGKPATTLHPDSLTHLFAEIPGNQATPHDIRRAFATTYGNFAELELHQIKLILDHSEGVASGDVTVNHYRFTDSKNKKWPLVRGWCDWVDAATERGVI